MFNLEQSIAEWRKQMLAAGIQSPVPLEELEIHLREEIERRMKSNLSEREIFNSAVQKIGPAHIIQNEFKKVDTGKRMLRSTMLIFGWLVANSALFYCIVGFDFNWNFFNFSPKWNRETVVDILGIVVAVAMLWPLAKASRDQVSRAVLLLISVLMAWNAVASFPPETVSTPAPYNFNPGEDPMHAFVATMIRRALQRHEPSPVWFRGGRLLLLCIPVVFWVLWERRHIVKKRDSKQEQYV